MKKITGRNILERKLPEEVENCWKITEKKCSEEQLPKIISDWTDWTTSFLLGRCPRTFSRVSKCFYKHRPMEFFLLEKAALVVVFVEETKFSVTSLTPFFR